MLNGTGIARKVVKPADCLLAFGIPTSKESFLQWQADPERDFVKGFLGGWPQYEHLFISILDDIRPMLHTWRVRIVESLSVLDLRTIFDGQADVVILFAHWRGDAVELFGGFVKPNAFLERMPNEFCGLIDLCVCHPPELVKVLRTSRPDRLTKFITKEATPGFWLYFYLALFKYLNDNDDTYLGGLERVVKLFIGGGDKN